MISKINKQISVNGHMENGWIGIKGGFVSNQAHKCHQQYLEESTPKCDIFLEVNFKLILPVYAVVFVMHSYSTAPLGGT